MRQSREKQFDTKNPPWLHCISRCVRRAFLCGDGYEHRKEWIAQRLRLLARCYAVDVGTYAIMGNHMHAIVRPRPERMADWSAERIARAWWCMRYNVDPIDGSDAKRSKETVAIDEADIARLAEDEDFVSRWRFRMGTVSWFMKALKEPLSRQANKEDDCTGTFWEGRFKSVPLLDSKAILACMNYVDLNPIRAQLADMPETSDFTGIQARIVQRRARQRAVAMRNEGNATEATSLLRDAGLTDNTQALSKAQQDRIHNDEEIFRSWLTPIHEMTSSQIGDPGYTIDVYMTMVDSTGRIIRGDKRGAIPKELTDILQRLDDTWTAEKWMNCMGQPGSFGGAVLGSAQSVAAEALRRGIRWMQHRCKLFSGRSQTE